MDESPEELIRLAMVQGNKNCPRCGDRFSKRFNLKRHLYRAHAVPADLLGISTNF